MFRLSFKPVYVALAALTLGVAGCGGSVSLSSNGGQTPAQGGGQSGAGAKTSQGGDDALITLALLAPQSGVNKGASNLGKALVNSARLGLADLNDKQVNLRIYDTAGDPAKAAAMAQKALGEGADIILGPLFSSSTKAVAPIAASAGVKVLSFSTDTSAAGGPVWVTGFLPEMEARRILSYAKAQGRSSVGVFYPETGYGQAALRGAQETQRAGLTQIVGTGGFNPGFAGVQAGAGSFAGSAGGADAVLIATGGTDLRSAGTFMDFHNFNPARVKFLGLGQWFSGSTLKERTLQGGWFPAPPTDLANAFSNRFARQFGSKPRFVAVLGYDAVQVAGQTLRETRAARSADPFDTETLTRPAGFKGAMGPIRFTKDGRNERGLAILEVAQGSFRTIDAAPTRFGRGS